jgi:Co/Zn/Cd efflux system component
MKYYRTNRDKFMAPCHHHDHDTPFDGISSDFKVALWVVIAINSIMFVVEMAAGALAGSQALKADALDFLGDTATYAISLYVIGMPLKTRANAALFKGASLALMGVWVLGATAYQVFVLGVPKPEIMGAIGLLALVANLASVLILMRYRNGDANVRSVWLCSRNDAIGNVAVMFAAVGVWWTATAWPDLFVAVIMAGLFCGPPYKSPVRLCRSVALPRIERQLTV